MSRTGGPPAPPRCPLGRLIADTADKEQLKRDGWRDHQILVIAIDDEQLSWDERETLLQIGEKRYGKRSR